MFDNEEESEDGTFSSHNVTEEDIERFRVKKPIKTCEFIKE